MHDCGGFMTAQKCVTPANGRKQTICQSETGKKRKTNTFRPFTNRTCQDSTQWWYRLGTHEVAICHRVLWPPILLLPYWFQSNPCDRLAKQLVWSNLCPLQRQPSTRLNRIYELNELHKIYLDSGKKTHWQLKFQRKLTAEWSYHAMMSSLRVLSSMPKLLLSQQSHWTII